MSAICPSVISQMPGQTVEPPSPLLEQLRFHFTQRALATRLKVNPKTVGRWERGEVPVPARVEPALRDILWSTIGRVTRPDNGKFRFVDLFCGYRRHPAGLRGRRRQVRIHKRMERLLQEDLYRVLRKLP